MTRIDNQGRPIFVQIAVDSAEDGRVHALDDDGRVWSWNSKTQWEWFPDTREKLA